MAYALVLETGVKKEKKQQADMAELADALDLESSEQSWGFKSLYPHHTDPRKSLAIKQGEIGGFYFNIGVSWRNKHKKHSKKSFDK